MARYQRLLGIALMVAMTAGLTGCSLPETVSSVWTNALEIAGVSQTQQQEALEENQREIYGQVVSAVGNEITLELGILKETGITSSDDGSSSALQQPDAARSENAPGGGEAGKENTGGGMRGGSNGGRNSGNDTGRMPSFSEEMGVGETSGAPEMPGGGGSGAQAGISLELTGEEQTYQIPPSVPVEYSMGDQTLTLSFTRISAENRLRLVLQRLDDGSEAVVKVQILG